MFEDAILDSDSLHSFNHCKMHPFLIFNKTSLKFPNGMGMGHVPKILEKNPVIIDNNKQTLCFCLANKMVALWNLQSGFLGSVAIALSSVANA
jgi:hypothetical protein